MSSTRSLFKFLPCYSTRRRKGWSSNRFRSNLQKRAGRSVNRRLYDEEDE